ncbi:MAG TPA: FAD-dependent oxidoreductase [Candidatus Binatia bacterium]
MKTDSGRSVSVWMATAEVPAQLPLTINARADVCIIGAGIAGMTTAYVLTREGKSVIVLDDGPIAGGETCRTTVTPSTARLVRDCRRCEQHDGSRVTAAVQGVVGVQRLSMDIRAPAQELQSTRQKQDDNDQ